MSNGKPSTNTQDALNLAFFNLAVTQTQGLMRLSNALRNDPNVMDETRTAAECVFATISEMLDHLNTISNAAWGSGHDD